MGITGLLPFLDQATRNCNISEFRGGTAVIDIYCWLHKGATACADVLARGEDTDVYVNFCMKYVNMLLKYGIKPILVFDGNHLPAKALTESRRRENRKKAKVRAAELLRLGKKDEAWNFFRQSIDITPKMAFKLIQECRRNNIDYVVAPYESDSQMAYLISEGIADVVITEDSDLVLFGCTKVFFKMDINGNGRLVEKDKLPICMKMKPDKYSFDKFRYMCILSGCDYLESLPGIGLKKALKFISLTEEVDPIKFLDKIPRYLNMKNQVITNEYKDNFMVALATFKHQVVFDPISRKLTYLTEPGLFGTRPEYCRNAGEFVDDNTAYQVAIGNLNPFSHEKLDDWSPTKNWKNNIHSIWSRTFVKRISRKESKELNKAENEKKETQRLEIQNKLNEEKKVIETAQAVDFESQLSIYYAKPRRKNLEDSVIQPKEEVDLNLVNKDCENENLNETTSSEELNVKQEAKSVSPILKKKFINPFLKKRFTKSNSTEMDSNVIVKSKYFHSKSEDSILVESDVENIKVEEEMSVGISEIKDEDVDCKKRKIDTLEMESVIEKTESKVDNIVNNKIAVFSSKNTSNSKKSKLSRCRSVGLSVTSQRKQPTLHALFANINKKRIE